MPAGIENFDSMFSVRQTPWHGRGVVLDEYPESIEEALEKSGLSWKVRQGQILVADDDGDPQELVRVARRLAEQYGNPEISEFPSPADMEELLAAANNASDLSLADGFRANRREDTGDVLGVVTDDYRVVQNEEAFRFLDALIGSELHFETAGSLYNGKRVWVLARLPEFVEVGGDEISTFLYVANSHDGSLAVTAAATPVRIVCANTLGLALRRSNAERTYKFRHTGDLQLKFEEARRVIGMTVNYEKRFKELGDQLALESFSASQMTGVAEKLFPIDRDSMGERAVKNREENRDRLVSTFLSGGPDGDTRGNAPGSKWCAVNAVAEYADWMRRTTKRTDQMSRSFEDSAMKQMGFEAILAA